MVEEALKVTLVVAAAVAEAFAAKTAIIIISRRPLPKAVAAGDSSSNSNNIPLFRALIPIPDAVVRLLHYMRKLRAILKPNDICLGMDEAMNGTSSYGSRAEAGPSNGRAVNRHRPVNDMDMVSVCSTCSSSSSDEEEDYSSYRLPAARRAAYGGVRISYVPNDAMALASARQRSQTLQSSSAGHPSRNAPSGDKEKDKNCIIS